MTESKLKVDLHNPLWTDYWYATFKHFTTRVKDVLKENNSVVIEQSIDDSFADVPLEIEIVTANDPERFHQLTANWQRETNLLYGVRIDSGSPHDQNMLRFSHDLTGVVFDGTRTVKYAEDEDYMIFVAEGNDLIMISKIKFFDLVALFEIEDSAHVQRELDSGLELEQAFEKLIDVSTRYSEDALEATVIANLKENPLTIPKRDWQEETFSLYERLVEQGVAEKEVTDLHVFYRIKEDS
jgi:hypothetical protein